MPRTFKLSFNPEMVPAEIAAFCAKKYLGIIAKFSLQGK